MYSYSHVDILDRHILVMKYTTVHTRTCVQKQLEIVNTRKYSYQKYLIRLIRYLDFFKKISDFEWGIKIGFISVDKDVPTLIINILSIEYFSARKKNISRGLRKKYGRLMWPTIQYNSYNQWRKEKRIL